MAEKESHSSHNSSNQSGSGSHHGSSSHHSSHHRRGYYDQEVDKRHVMKKMRSFRRSIKHYKKACDREEFKMEVHRYFYDNFHGFERHWLRHHCPIIMRLKLLFLGVNIRKLH